MQQIIDFFKGLFATDKWPARWHCGEWSDFHGWMYIISDLMIWTAYFLIPLVILNYLSAKKAIIKFQKVYLLFAAFILLCGMTHFFDAMMFWIPMYRLNALVRLVAGVTSLFTLFYLVKILPQAFKQKTSVELENEISRRIEAETKLAEANKSLEAFAYVVSHDLKEPLRKIRIYSQKLIGSTSENSDENRVAYVQKIITSSERMQAMVDDILTLSIVDNIAEFDNVLPGKAVAKAMQDLEIKLLESGASVNVGELPVVRGNEEYLAQLFMNLIGNAIKFSKSNPVIKIYGEVKGDKVIIYVKDNGIGIDENNVSKIFSPFQRLHNKTDFEGSGIGLAICKKIVDVHGGTISVQSKIGEGSTFIIELLKPDSAYK